MTSVTEHSMTNPLITVIMPCRNEEHYIRKILDFFVSAGPAEKELIVSDGESKDRTREIISSYSVAHPEIILISNPKRYVPYALNDCIAQAKGRYIIRLDAHTEYASDYFEKVIEAFEKTGAEIVGGPMRTKGTTSFQRAVAVCTSTVFGVGDSKFHDDSAEGFTDSVYLGAWRKEIFAITGMFDVEMLRNQDDEFHYRAKSMGMKIYLDPAIRSWYYPRSNFKTLTRQYFQYGLFKPLVLSKVKSEVKPRHLIPSAFLLYLLSLPLVWKVSGIISMLPLILYFALDVYFSFAKQNGFRQIAASLAIYPALHLSYGLGFLLGLNGSLRQFFFGDRKIVNSLKGQTP
jgi:succinoglycan biosynthesis protein ExoA